MSTPGRNSEAKRSQLVAAAVIATAVEAERQSLQFQAEHIQARRKADARQSCAGWGLVKLHQRTQALDRRQPVDAHR